jgi:hypothetical protein
MAIIDSINKENKIDDTTPYYQLKANMQVRLIEPEKTFKKTRYDATPHFFGIIDFSWKSRTISATHGLIKILIISQAILIDDTKIMETKTMAGAARKLGIEILKYSTKNESNKVKCGLTGGNDSYIDRIKVKE